MDYKALHDRMRQEWRDMPKDIEWHRRRQRWLALDRSDQSDEAAELRREFEWKIA
ncbi:hypothetical protein [Sphingobium agri]|uniref:Uncharacterized protein n=1 Tax=Sphingobium agri TaxID=2933566 RepID=A0ABT0DXF9_9SPHN|nr:hypothetical protein [Sphingobium agri]MCK0531785.1 hypothetical protein [Sphingobium agri]